MAVCAYQTDLGKAYVGDSLDYLGRLPDESVNLVLTSPPFALRRKKSYGNRSAEEYVDWFVPFAREVGRVLKEDGSFVFDIGGAWNKGVPTRNLYHFKLPVRLCEEEELFRLAQEFYWYNPAKMPAPAQWVNIERIRVKDAINPIWWLSKTERPKASNKRVLKPYSDSTEQMFDQGYNKGERPSGHTASDKWGERGEGAIPPNVIIAANTRSTSKYLENCKEYGLEVHPARFVEDIPEFFIKFLTTEGDLVVDPFAGSNVVGSVAERLGREWRSCELELQYVVGSAFRFGDVGSRVVEEYREELKCGREGAESG